MLKFIVRRVVWTIPVILLVILMTFGMMKLIKGNPFQVTERAVPVCAHLGLASLHEPAIGPASCRSRHLARHHHCQLQW